MDIPANNGGSSAGGVASMDGLVAAASPSEATGATFFSSPSLDKEPTRNEPLFGSALKMAKTEPFLASKSSPSPLLLRSNANSLFPEGQQMLSFSQPPASSSTKQESLLLCSDGSLPFYHLSSSSPASSFPGFIRGSGCLNLNLHGAMTGVKGYFTPSQWSELEQQAMIYKCLDANVPIPPSLLLSIRKSLYPSGYTSYSSGSVRSGTYGWGSFQLGFSGNADPEPGRCRRTDGKKWRCTRDAVADQKYCERHLNRGRHRSRKPVEGQTGQAKAMSVIARSPASLGNGSSNCPSAPPQKLLKSFEPPSTEAPPPLHLNRMLPMNREGVDGSQSGSFPITTTNPKNGDLQFLVAKQQHNPFEETSQGSYGLNCNNSLLDPSPTSFMEKRSCPLRSFMEEWPNNQPNRMRSSWAETEDDDLCDRTQLSMSIPFPSDLSNSSSPSQDKMSYPSLKLSQGPDPIHMGLGVGAVGNDIIQKQQANSTPMSWETSMGGPLGEVLNNTCNKDSTKNTSSLNIPNVEWETTDSSPTGVLQKTTFCSLSSSTGSSPRLDKYSNHESTGSLHDHLLGSSLFNPTTIPSL